MVFSKAHTLTTCTSGKLYNYLNHQTGYKLLQVLDLIWPKD